MTSRYSNTALKVLQAFNGRSSDILPHEKVAIARVINAVRYLDPDKIEKIAEELSQDIYNYNYSIERKVIYKDNV